MIVIECGVNTVGQFCIPCMNIYGTKYCNKTIVWNEGVKSCSAGYKGKNCDESKFINLSIYVCLKYFVVTVLSDENFDNYVQLNSNRHSHIQV